MGTDYLNLARQGAIMHGVDLIPKHGEVTAKRLKMYSLDSRIVIGDAETLPYRDETFDFVYSFGVIHHSPDTAKIVREIKRVLKPGARCWATVYHKNSLFFWWSVFAVHHVLLGGFLRESLKSRLSRIEYPNDNPNLVIRLYTKRVLASIFREVGFQSVNVSVDQIEPTHIAVFHRFLSRRMVEPLAHRFGWYVIADAQK